MGYELATKHEVVKMLTEALEKADSAAVQAVCCQCLGYIAMNNDGKEQCVQSGCVPPMVHLCKASNHDVRVHATAALLHVTNCLGGKVAGESVLSN